MHVLLHFHELFVFAHETTMFQVFRSTVFVIRGRLTRGETFVVSLDRVAIKEEEVHGVLLYM